MSQTHSRSISLLLFKALRPLVTEARGRVIGSGSGRNGETADAKAEREEIEQGYT